PGYHRRLISVGDRLSVQGGPVHAPSASSTAIPAARRLSAGIDLGAGKLLPIHGVPQLQPVAGVGHWILEAAGAVEEDDPLVWANPAVGERLLVGRIGRRGFGAEQQPFLGCDL